MVYNIWAPCRCDGIGRRSGLKIHRWRHRAGSSPATGTKIAPKFRASEQFFLPDCSHMDGTGIRRHNRICRRNLLVDCLLCLEIAKQRFKRCCQRKGSATGFCLGGIFLHHLGFFVDGELHNSVPDTDGLAFKINSIPFQTDNFTAAQAVERSKDNCQFQRITLRLICIFKANNQSHMDSGSAGISNSFLR